MGSPPAFGCTGTATVAASADLAQLASSCAIGYSGIIEVSSYVASATPSVASSPSVVTISVPIETISGSLEFDDIRFEDSGPFAISLPNLTQVQDLLFDDVYNLLWQVSLQTWRLPLKVGSLSFYNVLFGDTSAFSLNSSQLLPGSSMSFVNTSLSSIQSSVNSSVYTEITIGDNVHLQDVTLTGSPNESFSLHYASISYNTLETLDLSKLAYARHYLAIFGNHNLTNLSLPSLKTAGFINIYGNNELKIVDLPQLEQAEKVVVSGPVDQINFPKLRNQSALNVTVLSPPGKFQCSKLNGTGASCSTITNEHNHSGGLASSAKIGIGVGVGVGVFLILLGIFLLWFCGRRRRRSKNGSNISSGGEYSRELESNSPVSPVHYSDHVVDDAKEEKHTPRAPGLSIDEHIVPTGGDVQTRDKGADDQVVEMDEQQSLRHELEEQQGVRHELEEQQGVRHEMDARSLPDIDFSDEEDEEDRRSLEDIERSHNVS